MKKILTKNEVRLLKRGPSLFPPIIVNFLSGRTMIFHDKEGGSVLIADDVTPEDSLHIWVRLSDKHETKHFTGNAQYNIPGSKGSSYTVTLNLGEWACSCPGFGFRKQCRHINEAKETHLTKNC